MSVCGGVSAHVCIFVSISVFYLPEHFGEVEYVCVSVHSAAGQQTLIGLLSTS